MKGIIPLIALLVAVAVLLVTHKKPIAVVVAPEPPPAELPVIATLPAFAFTDQHGAPLGADQLRGHVWVADFIFTRCETICPLLTEKLSAIESQTRDLPSLRFVSFSVDPDYDTPPILAAYAAAHHAETPRWSFVTGPLSQVQDTVVHGLKVGMEPNPNSTGPGDAVLHGTHFVLIDATLHIRGYYDSSEPQALAKLAVDAHRLTQ